MNRQQHQLMEYLYGEMKEEDKQQFERRLQLDTQLQEELQALQQTRATLAQLTDEVPQPAFVPTAPSKSRRPRWLLPVGIAASFLLLLSLLNTSLSIGRDGFVLTIGPKKTASSQADLLIADSSELPATFDRLLAHQEANLNRQLNFLDSIWGERLTAQKLDLQRKWEMQFAAYQEQQQENLQIFARQFEEEKLPEFAALIQDLQLKQQQELRLLLIDFWEHWQKTREEDLESIGGEFANLYQNFENNKQQTEALLTSIVADR